MLTALSTPDGDKNTVNTSLTPVTPRKPVDNREFAAFARRIVRAYARRVASGDLGALTDLVALAAIVNDATGQAVEGLRELGYSWADIGRSLGMSKQAAQQRWGGERR